MLRYILKTGETTNKSEHNAVRTTALSETFSKLHNEYTGLRILASNDCTLLATKSCDALHHLGSCNS